MPAEEIIALIAFCLLVFGVWVYLIIRRFSRDFPIENLSPQAQRLARRYIFRYFLDGLLARPLARLTRREKFGLLLVIIVAVLAVLLTGKIK